MAKRGLGKGIHSLIGDYSMENRAPSEQKEEKPSDATVVTLSLKKIESNPGQPRKSFDNDTLQELADSIQAQGVLQPILVEESATTPDRYIIIAGERRYRAAKMAGLTHIPALIRNFSEEQRLEVALIENIQRENLNPIEEAQAYRFLIEQVSLSQEDLSRRLGKKRSTIANSLRLLNLSQDIQQTLVEGVITAGHARALLSVINPADRALLFKRIMKEAMSVRQAENSARILNNGGRAGGKKGKKHAGADEKPFEQRRVEEKFLGALGTKVSVKGSLQKGRLEISYYSSEDLLRVYKIISGSDDLFD